MDFKDKFQLVVDSCSRFLIIVTNMINFELDGLTLLNFHYGTGKSMGEEGAHNLFKKDDDGDTILHKVIINHRADYVTQILEKEDDIVKELINMQNNNWETPLHLTVVTGQDTMSEALVNKEACLGQRNIDGETSLHLAAKLGKNSCLDKILSHKNVKQTIDLPDDSGKSALHVAVDCQNIKAFDMLIKNGADVNFKNEVSGETALHYAVKKENEEMVRKLLDLDVDVNAETQDGDTPLHSVGNAQLRHLASLLLEKGADVFKKNKNGQSPHDLADKTMQRFLQRNRKDRKTRRRKTKEKPSSFPATPQNTSSIASSSAVSAFVQSESVLGTHHCPVKVPRLDDSNTVSTNLQLNNFQPAICESFPGTTGSAFYTECGFGMLGQDHGTTVPSSSFLTLSQPENINGKIDVSANIFGTRNHPPTTNVLTQGLSNQVNFGIQQPDLGQSSINADLVESLNSLISPASTTTTTIVSSQRPSDLTGLRLDSSQANIADQNLLTALRTVLSSQSLCVPSVTPASVSNVIGNQTLNIDAILGSRGIIDSDIRNLAAQMPSLAASVEEIARTMQIPPADVLERLFSQNNTQK